LAVRVQIPGQSFDQTWDMPQPRLLGSPPSPTPNDLCNCGLTQQHCYVDAKKERRRFVPDPDWPGHYREFRPGDDAAGIWACPLMRCGESYFL
jgi:hypothetical protein